MKLKFTHPLGRLAYVSVCGVFVVKVSSRPFAKFIKRWEAALRDRHYGLESRLENYEKGDDEVKGVEAVGEVSPAETAVDGNDQAEPRLVYDHEL